MEHLKEKLDDSVVVFGLRYKGLNVAQFQKFRKGMPEKSTVFVCKNSLMKVAVAEKTGWSTIGEKGCTGENAWVFVNEDEIADCIKHYNSFASDLEKEAKAAAPKGVQVEVPAGLSVAVMDNKYLSVEEFKRCESLPNKKQLYTTIAMLLKKPAQKIAFGVKAVPRKLAYGIKAIADLDEDKTKLVGDVAKPKSA